MCCIYNICAFMINSIKCSNIKTKPANNCANPVLIIVS